MVASLALKDRAARDPDVAGVKASRLAAAMDAQLPVLAGRILSMDASTEAIARGVQALEAGSGAPAAYLAAMESSVPPDLPDELVLRPAPDGHLLVVRSSTLLDDDGRWSGAFTSYLGIGVSDLATAIRGCWASAFSSDAVERCRETGTEIGSLRIGVLVQPFISFDTGGTAQVRRDGTVTVTAAPGGPVGVVGGRGGLDVIVGADGRVVDGSNGTASGAATAEAAAALARRAADAVAPGLIEWGAINDELYLLQIGPEPRPAAPVARPPRAAAPVSMPADAERLARLVTDFPGPLGEELVFPWALGAGDVPGSDGVLVDDPASALLEARALADELATKVWGETAEVARDRAAAVWRVLLEGRVEEGCREIGGLRRPDTAAARRVVGLARGVGAFMADAGVLPSPSLVWGLTAQELERAIGGARPSLRRGPGRWEPFVADVVRACGRDATGIPVSSGIAAGRLHELRELRAIGRPGPREVLVTPLPLPHLAPLLWHSAALVSIGGSSGAHLFEVARSLGVPAVIGVDPIASGGAGSLAAVDGDAGVVSILPPAATSSVRSPAVAGAMA
jgi:phosphohistidine swiveling domain-containing protein